MTMITPSYLGETIEYSSLHACRSTLEDPTSWKMPSISPARPWRSMRGGMPTPSRSSFPMTDRASRPTCSSASANPICRGGAARMRPRARIADSVLGCLSPARCLSAPAPRFPSPTEFFRTMARWFRSPGREAVSRRENPLRNRRFRAWSGRAGTGSSEWIMRRNGVSGVGRVTGSTLCGLGSAGPPRHMLYCPT